MFLRVYTKKIRIILLVPIFVQKYQIGFLMFFSLNLVIIFEKMIQFCLFSLNLLN